MKIIQLVPELNQGGVERGVVDINRYLVKDGIESFVISKGGKLGDILVKDGGKLIEFDVCSKNIFTIIPRVFKLRKILKDISPDIVHVRSRVPAWLIYFAKRGFDFKVVSTVHGINSPNLYSSVMVKADKIICGSNYTIEHILKNFNPQKEKIELIHRGIDIDYFNAKNLNYSFIKSFKKQYGIDNDSLVISSVGRITPWKSYETLIKATSLLNIKNLKVLIVGGIQDGKDSYFLKLKNLVKNLNIMDIVCFTGNVSEIKEIYALSDVVVSASKKPESFGRNIAEAIALNTPVVASNHGGAKDIIIEGVNGYFFEPLDYKELSEKLIMAKELKFDGFSYIKSKFSLEKMYNETLRIYNEVINE